MNRLFVLVGPIASYKSSFCDPAEAEGAVIVNDDAFQKALHGGKQKFDPNLEMGYKVVMEAAARVFLALGKDVVIDSTNSTRKSRCEWVDLGMRAGVDVVAVMFRRHDPFVHAMRRFKADNRGIDLQTWYGVAQRHDGQFRAQPIDRLSEGFSDVLSPELALELMGV